LASSRPSLHSVDVNDVIMVMLAFEAINRVKLEIRIGRVDDGEVSDLAIAVIANDASAPIGDLPPLASTSVTCSASNRKSLEAVLLAALYQLDFQLASGEFEKTLAK